MLLLALYAVSTLFGAFKLRLGAFLAVTALAALGYALVIILLIANRPEAINPVVEWIQCLGFLIVMLGFSVMGAEHSKLRRRVGRQNRELSQALDTISELANTDALTGLYNRRYIIDLLEHQKAQADRGDYGFVVCYIDLDYFKKINDRFGHSAGDMALCRVAEMARRQVRDMDYLARFGGEEFLLVLSRLNLSQGLVVAERLRRGVEACDYSDIHPELRLTVSVGAAQYQPGESVDDTLRRADEALYRAKEKGRNRVEAEGLGA
jgi:diguanylate cyclase (GGDEF)-like protein